MKLEEFDYSLPEERIAQQPLTERDASKMLVYSRQSKEISHERFLNLPAHLRAGDLLVFNQSKVVKARLIGERATGGRVEAFLLNQVDENRYHALLKCSAKKEPGLEFTVHDKLKVTLLEPGNEKGIFFIEVVPVAGKAGRTTEELIEQVGRVPLPPYITRDADSEDNKRYQTVYANTPGSVAAPTAGLHFTDRVFEALRERGVNTAFIDLHVGLGTFQPIKSKNIKDHVMHDELYSVSTEAAEAIADTKMNGGRVIAVGTTSLRAMESAALGNRERIVRPGTGHTGLYLKPGDTLNVIDGILTNFHQPKSSLMVLMAAILGLDELKRVYAEALDEGEYRFLSYGDCMLVL